MRRDPNHARATRSSRELRGGDEHGFVLVWFAILIIIMLGVAAFAVDLGHGYLVGQQVQDAADAAALSASSYLPDNCLNADAHAQSIAALNGFTDGVDNTTVSATNGSVGTGCDANSALSPNQIQVTVSTKVDTWFARALGIDTLSITRSSTAEYDPPVQLGSPNSTFGEAPGCSSCFQSNVWASVAGQDNRKVDGNAIYESWCANSTSSGGPAADNCPGSGLSSTDRDTNGMLFEISNPTGEALDIELYDPGFVNAGQSCTPATAYPICTGDEALSQQNPSAPALQTTYTLYPLDNLSNPLGDPPLCHATYPGYLTLPPAGATDLTASSFHKWASFAADAGGCGSLNQSSYVLQVQSGDDRGDAPEAGVNNFAIAACDASCAGGPTSNNTGVDVSAITKMSLFTNATPTTPNPQFYLARVPTWARGQVLTLSFFDVGDISNAAGSPIAGALTVQAVDATHGAGGAPVGEFANCTYSHPESRGNNPGDYITGEVTPWGTNPSATEFAASPNSLTTMGGGCTAPVDLNPATGASYWNGKWVTWQVPIPSDYTCNDRDLTKCWLQIKYNYGSAQFHDATTWTASLSGDPVRLTK